MGIELGLSKTTSDLQGILHLQTANLPQNISAEQAQEQGFVTVSHDLDLLREFHDIEPHIIAKENDTVVAYVLAMTAASKDTIPILIPMFQIFEEIMVDGRPVSESTYLVVGQVCVSKDHRGMGLFDRCYEAYREAFQDRYDFVITEVSDLNPRSIRAHERLGFREVHRYPAENGSEWVVVLWDWRKN
jgi:ribosomal protein S18 acetylase RimI-like enzyme